MVIKRLITMLPIIAIVFVAWLLIQSLLSISDEYRQWPRRLGRFVLAMLSGMAIFAVIYIAGGTIVGRFGFDYFDKPLLRLAHIVCLLGAYPAGLAAAWIFRTKHASLILGFALVAWVHLLDGSTYLGRMVFSDNAIPLNGDFALTNIALMLVATLLGGEAALRKVVPAASREAQKTAIEMESAGAVSLTSEGG
jgi:hypothetical protein